MAMVPLADMVNHWTPTSVDEQSYSCYFDVRGEAVVVLAARQIYAGEELTQLYDEKSDAVLLCQYGICPPAPAINSMNEAGLVVSPAVLCVAPSGQGVAEPSLVTARAAALERHV